MQRIELELGEETTIAAEGVEGEGNRWHVTGNGVVFDSVGADDGDVMNDTSLKVVAAQVGVTLLSFGPDVGVVATDRERFQGYRERPGEFFKARIEVVPVGAKGKAASQPASPLATSAMFNGLLPLNEVQERPSEKTPYGMDQFDTPVAPAPVFMAGEGENPATMARASEDAEATGPQSPAERAAEAEGSTEAADTGEGEGEEDGAALRGKLPEDFPGYAAFTAAGYTSYGKVRALKGDYSGVPGVGDVTGAKVDELLGGEK